MKTTFLLVLIVLTVMYSGCGPAADSNNMRSANSNSSDGEQVLTVMETPQRIKDMKASRGDMENAAPVLKIVEPAADATINSSTVKVKLELAGDLKGYEPGMDPATHTGNHVHVILDNQPYEAYYNLDQEFELRNVADGPHTIRVFPSRPWHESYKNVGAFQMVKFTVKNGGAEANKPATTNTGQQMSNANTNANANSNSNGNAAPTPEGKDMQTSNAGDVDPSKPLLTYSRPKGEYKGVDAESIMIDFWLSNARLTNDGGEFRIRYSIDGGEPKYLDTWVPIWVSGWKPGKHTIKFELVEKYGNLVDNGGYNSTTREFTVVK